MAKIYAVGIDVVTIDGSESPNSSHFPSLVTTDEVVANNKYEELSAKDERHHNGAARAYLMVAEDGMSDSWRMLRGGFA